MPCNLIRLAVPPLSTCHPVITFPCRQWGASSSAKAGHCFYLERDRFAERLIPSLYLFFIGFSFVNLLCTVAAVTLLSIFICIF